MLKLWPIALATALLVIIWSLVNGISNDIFENSVGFAGGHIRITNEQNYISDPLPVDKIVHLNPEVVWTVPQVKIKSLAMNKGRRQPVLIVGIEPIKAERFSALSKKLQAGRLMRSGIAETIIGTELAKTLKLKIGETVLLGTRNTQGQIAAVDQKVVGIFETKLPAIDQGVVYLPLEQAQELAGMDQGVSELAVIIRQASDAPRVAEQLKKALNQYKVNPWQEQRVMFFLINALRLVGAVVIFFIFLLAILITANYNNLQIMERHKELLNLKYLGLTNRELMQRLLLEALCSGAAAGLIGAMAGVLVLGVLNLIGLDVSALLFNNSAVGFIVTSLHRASLFWPSLFGGFGAALLAALLAMVPVARRLARELNLDVGFGRNPNL